MHQPLKMQVEARNHEKRRFGTLRTRLCALRTQDQLENLTNCPLLIATHSSFMLQPSQIQGEARNCKKRHFCALRARLCALRSQDQLENLINCLQLIATHSDFYASTLKNARGSQKLRKKAFWRALRAIVRAARTGSARKFDQLSITSCCT